MRGRGYYPDGEIVTPVEQAQAEVDALRSRLAEAELKLNRLANPWFGLGPGQARVRNGFVYTVDGSGTRRPFQEVE